MPPPRHWRRDVFLRRARYSGGLLGAYGTGIAELFVIVVLLGRTSDPTAHSLVTVRNTIACIVLLAVALLFAMVFTTKFVAPALRWYARHEEPSPDQQEEALGIIRRQMIAHVSMWCAAGIVFLLININSGGRNLSMIVIAVVAGGAAILCLGYLVTESSLRPVIAAAMKATSPERPAPSVMQRLLFTWALCTAIPVSAIVAIIVDRYTHWVIRGDTPIELPVLILALSALVAGLWGTSLVSRSVSDPVREVGLAMREVEHGRTDVTVSVHDSSEIGRLQVGFNRMVAEVAERERLRDLFDRHVGQSVATRALEQDALLGGEVRKAAVLFIDLAGSTAFAATRPPTEVAELLNDFFRIVVTAVDKHNGFINKFGGDAALAIFGVPDQINDPAGAALAAARELRESLRDLESVDFGIGVSYGIVFAGNIGAEQRYEYTVIGDPVNEAARLTERAKERAGRILAAQRVVAAASRGESLHWRSSGRTRLRGRISRTVYAEPIPTTD